MKGICALTAKDTRETTSLHCARMQKEGSHLQTRKTALFSNQTGQHFDLRLPASRTVEK